MKKQKTFKNPILPGFYPDPSICRVGNDFYMVNSTFSYFPGIPISHSKDLVNWRQIGNVINRPEQLDRSGIRHSQGVFAPTIRWHEGRFYVLCTHVTGKGNFMVTAEDPAGPWSDPYWLDAEGIDPSIFFDDDGTAWYCGTKEMPDPKYYGDNQIYAQKLDLKRKRLVGESTLIWRTALNNAVWPEGPHIYKVDSWYYLIYAEGGTGVDHAICVARSRKLLEGWEGKPSNPILTHRHLQNKAPFINVGHADLVDDPKGNWWMVALASRPYGDQGSYNMGRETFLIPVDWAEEWPIASPETGMVDPEFPFPDLPETPVHVEPACDHFEGARLPLHWISLQSDSSFQRLCERPGYLRVSMTDPSLRNPFHSAFVGRRQRHLSWSFSCRMEMASRTGERAGIALVQNHDYQYRLEVTRKEGRPWIAVVKAEGDEDRFLSGRQLNLSEYEELEEGGTLRLVLVVRADGQSLNFFYGREAYDLQTLARNLEGDILSTTKAGGFVGTVLGVFANADKPCDHCVDFAWVEYQGQ